MDEEKTNEAEPKKPDLKASIQCMTECLEDVLANAKAALTLSKDMDRDGMKWMTLSKAVFDVHELSRMGWQKLVDPPTAYDPAAGTGGGAFFTPKQAIDFIMGNPPFGEVKDVPTPIDPNAPQIAQGEEPTSKRARPRRPRRCRMPDDVKKIVLDVLDKGRYMRQAQKAYFTLRTQDKLTEAKAAERDFDAVLAEADYALRTGKPKPVQEELPL